MSNLNWFLLSVCGLVAITSAVLYRLWKKLNNDDDDDDEILGI